MEEEEVGEGQLHPVLRGRLEVHPTLEAGRVGPREVGALERAVHPLPLPARPQPRLHHLVAAEHCRGGRSRISDDSEVILDDLVAPHDLRVCPPATQLQGLPREPGQAW